MENRTHTIVLTGGPCGGKSAALAKIAERLDGLGYQVYCIPEAATQLILAGSNPVGKTPSDGFRFQAAVIQLQDAWEKTIREQAKHCGRNAVILLDRGLWDGAAYVNREQWGEILRENRIATIERDLRYDAVLHLVTAANGAEEAYTTANNKARRESPAEAREADQRTMDAWTGHPHLRIIGNETGFEEKIHRALKEITSYLGEPEPIETERKFTVAINPSQLNALPHATSDIVQHYLNTPEGELRLRRRGRDGQWAYTRNQKIDIPDRPGSRIEFESRISGEDYWNLLAQYPEAPKVTKTRTCIVYRGTYFELDKIELPDGKFLDLLEVETEETGEVNPPPGIWITDEVTHNKKYHNRSLAR